MAPLASSGGFKHGAVAAPAQGKTTILRQVLLRFLNTVPNSTAFVHDVSGRRAQYPGLLWGRVDTFKARGGFLPGDPRCVVFRGEEEPIENVAELALDPRQVLPAGAPSGPSMLVADEIEYACTEGTNRLRKEARPVRQVFTIGRRRGASGLWSCQLLQYVPISVFGLSTSISLGNSPEPALEYMEAKLRVPHQVVELLPKLDVGEFVLYRPGFGASLDVYKFPVTP